MKNILKIAALLIVMVSCKKSQNTNPTTDGKKLLLSDETDLYADGTSVNAEYKFLYDGNNRMIQVTTLPYDTVSFVYDNSDNLTTINYSKNLYLPSAIFSYNGGIPVSLARGDQPTEATNNFLVSNNQVTSITGLGATFNIVYQGNNFKTIAETDFSNDLVKVTFTYGTKKSPFYYGGFKWYFGDYISYNEIQSQNEVIERVDENTGAATGDFTFSYEYNSDGYPTKATDYKNGVLTGYQVFTYIPGN